MQTMNSMIYIWKAVRFVAKRGHPQPRIQSKARSLSTHPGYFHLYLTNMYPMVLMCLSPLSAPRVASLPHVLLWSWSPPPPKPILESQVAQSSWLLLIIPILAFDWAGLLLWAALNPSMLHFFCKDASAPINVFHLSLPREVGLYCPSAIREYSEVPFWSITKNLTGWFPILMPTQISENFLFQ